MDRVTLTLERETAETMNSGIEAAILAKSVLHNIGVVLVGFCFALLGRAIDSFLGIAKLHSRVVIAGAVLLLGIGFLLRVWATYLFYAQHMKVISLVPQNALITSGPYRISRNPLYLGGNVFIFLGAVLYLGSSRLAWCRRQRSSIHSLIISWAIVPELTARHLLGSPSAFPRASFANGP